MKPEPITSDRSKAAATAPATNAWLTLTLTKKAGRHINHDLCPACAVDLERFFDKAPAPDLDTTWRPTTPTMTEAECLQVYRAIVPTPEHETTRAATLAPFMSEPGSLVAGDVVEFIRDNGRPDIMPGLYLAIAIADRHVTPYRWRFARLNDQGAITSTNVYATADECVLRQSADETES